MLTICSMTQNILNLVHVLCRGEGTFFEQQVLYKHWYHTLYKSSAMHE